MGQKGTVKRLTSIIREVYDVALLVRQLQCQWTLQK